VQGLLVAFGAAIVAPVFYLVTTAFKTQDQWITDPLNPLPNPATTENLGKFLAVVDVPLVMGNTLLITVLATIGTVLSCAIVAYPLARIDFRGRNLVTLGVLSTMLLPAQVLMIPQYLLFLNLGWVNTFLPLIVPNYLAVNAFIVFFLRQAFRTIPKELDDAVLVDGGTRFTAFWRVIVPLSRLPLLIAALLQAISVYNDYFTPLLYLHSPDKQTMAIAVPMSGASVPGVTAAPVVAMGTLLFVIPMLIVFLFAQRWLTRGVQLTGGVKG
jgi:multiple sugar transport system permease protein